LNRWYVPKGGRAPLTDHRAIKRLVRPMLGFKSFRSAAVTLAGIELMDMIPKVQLRTGEMCLARQFYSLAG
jgi:transposase-like protein